MNHSGMDHSKHNQMLGMNMNKSDHHGMNMPMYFHSGTMVTLFFKEWMTMTTTEYNGACAAIAILAFFYEGFKVLRQYLAAKQLMLSKVAPSQGFIKLTPKKSIILHLVQTILHMIQIFFGYLLMLAFMTYNTGVCVATILGFGMGYLVFGWYNPTANLKTADGECCNM